MGKLDQKVLLVLMVFFVIFGICFANNPEEYDEEGRLTNTGISAKIAANFPDTTLGTAVIFSSDIFTTPTINLRYRAVPLPSKSWMRLVTPDYLSVGLGTEHILSGLQWELIPELLTIGGGAAYNTVEEDFLGYTSFEFLEF